MKKQNKIFSVCITLAIVSVTLFWFLQDQQEHHHSHEHVHGHSHDHDHEHEDTQVNLTDEQIKDLEVTTEQAHPGKLTQTLAARGKIILHPDRVAHILPKISSVAKEAKKNIGDPVDEGETLAILESKEMADIKADYLASIQRNLLAQTTYEREARLREKKISSEEDYLKAKSSCEEAKINLQLAEQKLHAYGVDPAELSHISKDNPELRFFELRSPIKGNIIQRNLTQGEYIENTQTIYQIANFDTVWVEIGIYPKDLHRVKEGQLAEISLPGENMHVKAKIIYVSPIIENETITATAFAELSNPNGFWRPGSFVQANIITAKINVPLMIPKEALQNLEGQTVIFVKSPEGFEVRKVETGRSDNHHIEITSGLELDETYAASNTFSLKAELGKMSAEHAD